MLVSIKMLVMRHQLLLLRRQLVNQTCRYQRTAAAVSDFDVSGAKPFEDIPGPIGRYTWPVLGTAFLFKSFPNYTQQEVHLMYNDLLDRYGPLVRIRMGKWTVLVQDAADIELVMKNEGKYPDRSYPLVHRLLCEKKGFRLGLAHLRGEEWHKFRSPVNTRMMRTKSAHFYLPQQNLVADDLVSILKSGNVKQEEILDLLFKYACESISVVTFDKRLGYMKQNLSPEQEQALEDTHQVFALMMKSFSVHPFLLKHFPLRIKKDYFDAMTRLVERTEEYYRDAMKDIERRQTEGTLDVDDQNLMMSLMATDKLTPEDMGAVALDLFGAGTDSTARNLYIFLYNLARNPDKQQKLYEEIIDKMGPSGDLTQDNLPQMTYLLACLKESFRIIYPTVAGTQRYLPKDIVLQGYRIPAGTIITLMNQKTVKDERFFPSPESYIPERWFRDEQGKRETRIPPSALLPFGFGPRQCLGKRFAEQEIYLAATKIIQNFEVSLEPGHEEIGLIYTAFPGTKTPIRFVFKNRN